MFSGRSFFHYRRIISTTGNDPLSGTPAPKDQTLVNWNRGNDWSWMNPPLILTQAQIDASGQRQNWLGGISTVALKQGEARSLLFAEWLLETQTQEFRLNYLSGANSPLGTESGLSMVPYIREGRRILARNDFQLREADLRRDLPGGRTFDDPVALVHYDIDIHGCRYRNGEPSLEASSAPALQHLVRPTQIPLTSLIPQGVDNVLIGGKALAVTHIANAFTRTHYSEWSIGAAAGATAGWLVVRPQLTPEAIAEAGSFPQLQHHLQRQGLRWHW